MTGESVSGAVLGGDGATSFGFRAGGVLRVGSIGGELSWGDRGERGEWESGFGDSCDGDRRRRDRFDRCGGCLNWLGGETGFAVCLSLLVRSGTALFAVHGIDAFLYCSEKLRRRTRGALSWFENNGGWGWARSWEVSFSSGKACKSLGEWEIKNRRIFFESCD